MENVTVIYRLKPAESVPEVPDLNLFQFADILGDNDLSLVRRQPRTNESLLARWTSSQCELAAEYRQGAVIPDVSVWGSYLLMSHRAYTVFNSVIVDAGEFLPLQVGDMPMYIFVPLFFAGENRTRTRFCYKDGVACGLETLVFEPCSIAGKSIFKSEMYGPTGIFVTDAFKKMFDKHGFEGLVFDQNLAGIF